MTVLNSQNKLRIPGVEDAVTVDYTLFLGTCGIRDLNKSKISQSNYNKKMFIDKTPISIKFKTNRNKLTKTQNIIISEVFSFSIYF